MIGKLVAYNPSTPHISMLIGVIENAQQETIELANRGCWKLAIVWNELQIEIKQVIDEARGMRVNQMRQQWKMQMRKAN